MTTPRTVESGRDCWPVLQLPKYPAALDNYGRTRK
jgi:hypothetical protein